MKVFKKNKILIFCAILGCSFLFIQCKNENKAKKLDDSPSKETQNNDVEVIKEKPDSLTPPKGMVWIPGRIYYQGAAPNDKMAKPHEKPAHRVAVDGFFMDTTEVTNAQFQKFVKETGYKTVAERPINWEEMKKELPPNTPKPPDSVLQPGSLIFKKIPGKVTNLNDYSQWWQWKIGTNWKHPKGPGSTINGKENYPVVHIALEDARAYCQWAGTSLPTEAEWELAARGGKKRQIYFWGNESETLKERANTWGGDFPNSNNGEDGFVNSAPVASFPPNAFGLYDMAGNVWEWTQDWYNDAYYSQLKQQPDIAKNPQGATEAYNKNNPRIHEKVIRGGSFLCNASYCASYRNSARMATSTDSAMEHLGFRTIKRIK